MNLHIQLQDWKFHEINDIFRSRNWQYLCLSLPFCDAVSFVNGEQANVWFESFIFPNWSPCLINDYLGIANQKLVSTLADVWKKKWYEQMSSCIYFALILFTPTHFRLDLLKTQDKSTDIICHFYNLVYTVETLYSTIEYRKYHTECNHNSDFEFTKTPYTSPLRASYGSLLWILFQKSPYFKECLLYYTWNWPSKYSFGDDPIWSTDKPRDVRRAFWSVISAFTRQTRSTAHGAFDGWSCKENWRNILQRQK